MTPEILDLIGQLFVQSGMLMEDGSPEMVMRLPADQVAVSARLDRLERTGSDVIALAAAARVLLRLATDEASKD